MSSIFDSVPVTTQQNLMPTVIPVTSEEKTKLQNKLALFSPQDRTQLMAMKDSLVVTDVGSITKYASNVSEMTNQLTDNILKSVNASCLDDVMGTKINSILADAKRINGNSLRNVRTPGGIFMKIFPFLYQTKEKVLAQFSTMATQIQKTADEIKKSMVQASGDIKTMEQLGKTCVQQYNMLDAMVVAGHIREQELREEVATEKAEFEATPKDELDPLKFQDLQKKINFVDTLGKKISNLEQVQQVIYIQIPQLETMIKNSVDSVNEFQTILDTTIPVWKTSFTQAIIIDSQQRNAELTKAAKDFTNEQLKKNATNLKIASIEIAKQGARGIVDPETIQHMQDELVAQITGCMDIYKTAATQRKELSTKIETMRIEFKQSLQGTN